VEIDRYKITIYSENPDKLQEFYRDILGFSFDRKMDMPDDYGYVFKLADNFELYISYHSEVKGINKDKYRHIFDFRVSQVDAFFEEILQRCPDLDVVAKPFDAPCSRVVTFSDPEGNCWQISERSSSADCEI
jgi:predicted enzyme related to lactoylglutathione lyase